MTSLTSYVRRIEDKYGKEWYLNNALDLSQDDDWKMILKLRVKYFQTPIQNEKYNYSGNPKKWTDECREYVKEEICDLLDSGVVEITKINKKFGFSAGNKRWVKSVLDYFDLKDYYQECVERSKQIVLVADAGITYCKNLHEVVEKTGFTYKYVNFSLNTKRKIGSYSVYHYNEYLEQLH